MASELLAVINNWQRKGGKKGKGKGVEKGKSGGKKGGGRGRGRGKGGDARKVQEMTATELTKREDGVATTATSTAGVVTLGQEQRMVFAVPQQEVQVQWGDGVAVYLDSACFAHVCPPWFGAQFPMMEVRDAGGVIRAADGRQGCRSPPPHAPYIARSSPRCARRRPPA